MHPHYTVAYAQFLLCATRIILQGYSCCPSPLQKFTTFEVTFFTSAVTNIYLITLNHIVVCRLRSTIPSASKRLSQYSLFFALSLGFMLLHQKKNHQKIVFLVPHAGVEPTNQRMVPELESGVSANSTNGA